MVVGVSQARDLTRPRRFLVDLLTWLHDVGDPADVALLRTGPIRSQIEAVARVRFMPDLLPWSPAGMTERVLGRVGRTGEAKALRQVRLSRRHRWLVGRPAVHLNNPQAVALLRYLPEPASFVSLYVHPEEILGISDLAPVDRELLLDQVGWYLAADEPTADELRGTRGVAPDRVTVRSRPIVGAHGCPGSDQVRKARRTAGIPDGAPVVAIPAVPDWVDHPDLTIALAWELHRRRPSNPPHIRWHGGPYDERRRWPMEHELRRMGLDTVHLDHTPSPTDAGLSPVATGDVVVLPTRGPSGVDAMLHAQSWCVPALCWSNHPAAEEVQAWTDGVVPFPDVEGMADRVLTLLDDEARRRRLGADHRRGEMLQRDAETVVARLRGAPCPCPQ